MGRQLSEHFNEDEFRDHRTGQVKVDMKLVTALENLRAIVGRPLRIVSGYRSPSTNKLVGGARFSRHMKGDAADIPRGYATVAQAERAGFVGIGRKGTSAVHVDTRPGPPARWVY